MLPANQLPILDILNVIAKAEVPKLMGERKTRRLVIDYVPPREATMLPRDSEQDGPLEVYPPVPIQLTFQIEDAMFGGEVWAAITCGNRVVVAPFLWRGFDELAKTNFTIVGRG